MRINNTKAAVVAGLTAVSLSLGAVAPVQAAPKPDSKVSLPSSSNSKNKKGKAEGSSVDEFTSGLSSDSKTSKSKKTSAKDGGYEQLSAKVGLDGVQAWYNNSNETGQTILKIVGAIALLEVVGFLFGPIRSFIFNTFHV
ncbi:hypothetical protein [Corynebacterium aquilae]|uniref:Uncharacterized protein n=1 Tax=Corynebacterium aquilae DSM 44791 TaxID=1431546 RepID=A0A1L7CFU2_9CORY|nr:hypothetical protein [Corynebacterium aquilae]APT84740.1 hypothetical protein CAQU_06280 [Corynebacterium aquilae DSM 44791]